MGLGSPISGTLQEAQQRVLGLMDPEGTPVPTEEDASPDRDAQEPGDRSEESQELAPSEQPDEVSEESESEESSEDYTTEEENPRTFKVKADGQTLEITEEELIRGYSRQKDYTQKTQVLSEQSKRLESITRDADAARARMSQVLPELETNLLSVKKQLEAEPDWDKLYKVDPTKAARLQREFDKKKVENASELQRVQQERQRLLAENEFHARSERDQFLSEQGKELLTKIPEWKDEKVASREKQDIEKWCLSNGYLDQGRLDSIMDWGSVAIMRKAWLFDQGKSKARKQKARTSKTLSPGSKGSAPGRNAMSKQRNLLKKSGKAKDAQLYVEQLLNRQRS